MRPVALPPLLTHLAASLATTRLQGLREARRSLSAIVAHFGWLWAHAVFDLHFLLASCGVTGWGSATARCRVALHTTNGAVLPMEHTSMVFLVCFFSSRHSCRISSTHPADIESVNLAGWLTNCGLQLRHEPHARYPDLRTSAAPLVVTSAFRIFDMLCRYIDWEGELRTARPPQQAAEAASNLLPAAARAALPR